MPDFIEVMLLVGLRRDSLAVVAYVNELSTLIVEGVPVSSFFFRKPVIFLNRVPKPKRLRSMSDWIVGAMDGARVLPTVDGLVDKLVMGRISLESQEVGAVDWEVMELFGVPEDMVVADREEATMGSSAGDCKGSRPKLRAS